jgi:hypothetical protein
MRERDDDTRRRATAVGETRGDRCTEYSRA